LFLTIIIEYTSERDDFVESIDVESDWPRALAKFS
jgi:hypothetical protein